MQRADSFGSCFDLPVSVGALPGHRASGALATNHDLHASAFQLCDTQHAGDWESYLPWRKERHPQRVCFQASICSKSFASQVSDLRACSKDLNSRVRAMCLPAHSEPCKHIPGSERCCPWGRKLRECVWGGRVPCWGHRVEGTLHIQWAPGEELWTGPSLEISQCKEQRKLCQKEENSNGMDFQAVARSHHVRAPRERNVNFGP